MEDVLEHWEMLVWVEGYVEAVDDVDLEEISWLRLKWERPTREDKDRNVTILEIKEF